MATKKKTQAEKIATIPIEQISKISSSDRKKLEKYVSTLRQGYKRRVSSLSKRGLTSHAQIAFEGSVAASKPLQLTKLSRNQLILEFARYAKFFNDVTSSEAGIRKVNLEQDLRIFGKNAKGKPRRTMTDKERQRFWALYEEYNNQHPTASSRFGSESVQQQIADAIFGDDTISGKNLIDILDSVEQSLVEKSIQENMGSVPNVYSGRRNPFTE